VDVILIQSSVISPEVLGQWKEKLDFGFKIAMMTGDVQTIRWSWGVEALPWLILTDKGHIVVAEGFRLDELNEKLGVNI
jgi:hypothetical protein